MNETMLKQFLDRSKAGYLLYKLDQPLDWNGCIDRDKQIDFYYTRAYVSYCNKAYAELMKIDEKNILHKTSSDLFLNREYGKRSVRELLEHGIQRIGAFEIRPGVWLEVNNQCIFDENGLIVGHTSMLYDVSYKKKEMQIIADQDATKQIANYQYLIMPDGSESFVPYGYDFFEVFGIAPDKPLNTIQDLFDLVYINDVERYMAIVTDAFKNNTNIEAEFRINHSRKGIRWIKNIALPDKTSDGRTVWNGYFRDCTERKKTDEWIGFLSTALMNISDSVILTNNAGEIIYANQRVKDLHGYEPDELIGCFSTVMRPNPVTDEEQDEVLKFLREGKTYSGIDTSRRKDGSTFICEYSVSPIFDENGSLYASIGIQNDITERIRMVDALRQSNEQLRATLLSVGEGVISTDAQGIVTMMNPIAEELTEWPQEKAQGKRFSEVFTIIGEVDKQPCGDPAGIVLKTSSSYKTTDPVLLVSQSGREKPVEIQASPIKNDNGATTGAVIVFRDYTEYRERQKKIEYLSFHDPLTGLYNRRFMEDAVSRADLAKNLPLTVMIVDVNGLKLTNDAFGHKTGDQLLIAVAGILRQTCKPDSVIARMGGDEFQILMPMTNIQEAKIIKQNINKAAESVTLDSAIVSLAIGISVKSDPDESIEVIMINADNQMYKEKLKHGKIMRNQTVETVLRNINYKYDREQIHTEMVSRYSEAISRAMGLGEHEVTDIKNAGVLHDIGKIVVPPELLNKPDKLTEEEYDIVKRHTEIGYQILKSADEYAKLADYVLYHHEHWDGTGYPQGLKGAEIPLQARIIAVADAFEAMTALRSYQKTRSTEDAAAELIRCSGKQFDPHIVDIFVKHVLGLV